MTKMMLPVQLAQTPSTIAQAIHAVLQFTDKANLSLSEVMGYTSHAFRINLRLKSIETDSVYSFHGGQSLRRNFLALGFQPLNLCPPVKTITPSLLCDVIDTIRDSLRRGFPVIGWDLFAKQFGVIYGFDDAKKVLYAKDNGMDGTIHYEQLPNRRILCLATVEESLGTDRNEMLIKALEAILDHAYGRDGLAFDHVKSGLSSYDAWMDAFAAGDKISNKGNAFNLHVISDARRHAAAFLEILSRQYEAPVTSGTNVKHLAQKSSSLFAQVAESLGELETMYPYPLSKKSANPRLKENVPRSLELLGRAKAFEQRGIEVLNEMYTVIKPA